jgi:hypothetical protein
LVGCGAALLGAATVTATPLPAQGIAEAAGDTTRSVLTGFLTDTAGIPLQFGSITAATAAGWVTSGPDGHFRVTGVAPGWQEVVVRRPGYRPLLFELQFPPNATVHVVLRLTPLIMELPAIVVEGKRQYATLVQNGYYRRQRAGWGTYFGPEELENIHVPATSSVLRRAPGVRVAPPPGHILDVVVYGRNARGDCPMRILVNRFPLPPGIPVDQFVHPKDILAIEVYPRSTSAPAELREPFSDCGVVAIWTR